MKEGDDGVIIHIEENRPFKEKSDAVQERDRLLIPAGQRSS